VGPLGSEDIGPLIVYDRQSFSAPSMIAFSNNIAKRRNSLFNYLDLFE
jgi:hypothetical protein